MATLKTEGSYNAQLNSSRNLALDIAHAAFAAHSNNTNMSADAVAMNAVAASALLSHSSSSGIAIAQAAIQQKQTEQHVLSALTKSLRNQVEQSSTYAPSMASLAASGQQLSPPSCPFNAAVASTTTYPYPDTSKYIYDESTRFYYDPVTGLLYEPNSKYFYDRTSQQYYYWDQTKSTYFPVPQSDNTQPSTTDSTVEQSNSLEQDSDTSKPKDDKGKSAQQIAKEMEKWAKRMNAQKKSGFGTIQRTDVPSSEASRSADTGYAILEASTNIVSDSRTIANDGNSNSLVAEYGGVEDSDDEQDKHSRQSTNTSNDNRALNEMETKVLEDESKLLDWSKLACMLCSRGFKDTATLQKHRAFSSLHYENLNKLRSKYGLAPIPTPNPTPTFGDIGENSKNKLSIASLMQIGAQAANDHAKNVATRQTVSHTTKNNPYRDRAKERRDKYGIPSPPAITSSNHSPVKQPIIEIFNLPVPTVSPVNIPLPNATNVGSRLMEKMGWQEGQGLGRANQGRTELVEAEFREAGVGLGVKISKRGAQSDNYKDNVKRAMYARFHELD